uniref:G domain-containing protein n=1 Tax=Clytia hemisphaerica TaxID=252671 RepID=A0A7M6DPS4_9CNID
SIFKAKDVVDAPFVILVGKVGTGKSTIVEKVTGVKGRKSKSSESFTTESEYFWAKDKSLLIADRPGTNSRKGRLEHNLEVASAFNFRPVSKVFVVVKADIRLDQTIDDVNSFCEAFQTIPDETLGVLVTHMDVDKEWTQNDMMEALERDFRITSVVFFGNKGKVKKIGLKRDIIANCQKEPTIINITSEVFLRCFKLTSGSERNILRVTSRLVSKFIQYKECFEKEKERLEADRSISVDEMADLFFEYKAFMEAEVDKAKDKFCKELEIDFCQDDATNIKHAGYMANMVNQIRAIIQDIRVKALTYQNDHNSSDLRKCRHCGCVWVRAQDCDDWTTCGNLPCSYSDKNGYEMAIYSFKLLEDGDFNIEKTGSKTFKKDPLHGKLSEVSTGSYTLPEAQNLDEKVRNMRFMKIPKEYEYLQEGQKGCGRLIKWKDMKVVPIPKEFRLKDEQHVTTDDILSLPEEAQSVYDALNRTLKLKKK